MRTYFNLLASGKAARVVETVGTPLRLPDLDADFAIVRPYFPLAGYANSGWQVIHVRSGYRIMASHGDEPTRALAKASAMAHLEATVKKRGLEYVQSMVKRKKHPLIVAALAMLEGRAKKRDGVKA